MSTWVNAFKSPVDFLLMEDSDFLLLEQDTTGDDFIVLNQTGDSSSLWSNQIKH